MSSVREVEYRVVEKLDEQGRLLRRTWHDHRSYMVHHTSGPAVQIFEPSSGMLTGEIWINQHQHGKHRDGNLPSEKSIDPKTGIITREEYYFHGRHHRDDGGPTEIYRDSSTGHVTTLVFSYEGYIDREGDQAAVQEFSPEDGRLLREEFYRMGQRHRDGGPAIIEYDLTGKPLLSSLQYFQHGKIVQPTGEFYPPEP